MQDALRTLDTAQARFTDWFDAHFATGREAALQIWCKINSVIDGNRMLAATSLQTGSPAQIEASYDRVGRGLGGWVTHLVAPVLGGLAGGLIVLALGGSSLAAAIVTLLVFAALLLRNGGSLDGIKAWIGEKLAVLKAF